MESRLTGGFARMEEMSAALADASGVDNWIQKGIDLGSLLACANAAAPIKEIWGGVSGRGEEVGGIGVDGGIDGGTDGWVRDGKDSAEEGAIDIRGPIGAGVRKVSHLNSQSIGGL
jgi:hypothetical protein